VKVAFLLYGCPRTYEFCFPSVKKHILDVYDPDVFICTDSEEEGMNKYNPVFLEIRPEYEILGDAKRLRARFGESQVKNRELSSSWKVLQCTLAKKRYEHINNFIYDVVLFGRFDAKYLYIQPIESPQENTIYIPQVDARQEAPKNGLTYNGYSAQLFWCSSQVADIMGTSYYAERNYTGELKVEMNDEPERVFKYVCDENHICPQYVDIKFMIIKGTSDHPLAFDFKTLERYPEYL
jgi:hypothetical protein